MLSLNKREAMIIQFALLQYGYEAYRLAEIEAEKPHLLNAEPPEEALQKNADDAWILKEKIEQEMGLKTVGLRPRFLEDSERKVAWNRQKSPSG